MWRYSYNLKGLYETPALPRGLDDWAPDRAAGERHHQDARARPAARILTEFESKQLLAAYGIPTVGRRVIASDDDAGGESGRADRLSRWC